MELIQIAEAELDTLTTAIKAVDRLNSYARSTECKCQLASPKRAIYWLKKEALKAALEHRDYLNVACRNIKVEVHCNRCDGHGDYYDDYHEYRGSCWHCDRGLATLKFVETKIGGNISWHTPYIDFPQTVEGDFELIEDWQPNQTGRSMGVIEVAACMNIAEPYFIERYRKRWPIAWFKDFGYYLDIGYSREGECCLCGAEGNHLLHSIVRDRLNYHAAICDRCKAIIALQGLDVHRDRVVDFPTEITEHPEIKAWQQRRADGTFERSNSGRNQSTATADRQ